MSHYVATTEKIWSVLYVLLKNMSECQWSIAPWQSCRFWPRRSGFKSRRGPIYYRIQIDYSKRPKTERSDFGIFRSSSVAISFSFRKPNHISFGSFSFQMFGLVKKKSNRTIQFRLDRFTIKGVIKIIIFIYKMVQSSNRTKKMNRTFRFRTLTVHIQVLLYQ